MFAAVMEGNLSLEAGWTHNSTIEHLCSPSGPAGPFSPIGRNPIKGAEAHNPSAAWDPHTKQCHLRNMGTATTGLDWLG
jgi:hypothetical protein